ncbi:MAG: DUF3078 domain-containing protein [Calditrichia bacterium]
MYLKRSVTTLIIILLLTAGLLAQEKEKKEPTYGWIKNVVGSLNLTQTNFSNWEQGGEDNLAWQFNFNSKFVRNEPAYNWSNKGKLTYGQVKLGDQDSRKSVDEIKLESVYTRKIGIFVNPYASATMETQFAKGYQYSDTAQPQLISDFADPVVFTESIGLGYSHNELIKSRLGISLKETIAPDDDIRFLKGLPTYADDPDTPEIETSRTELGAESVTELSWEMVKNTLLTSRLELFSNMQQIKEVDVKWDTILTAKVNQYVNVNFNVKLYYDNDISKKRQLKQALALGLTYTFI